MAYEDTWWNHQGATLPESVLPIGPRRGDFGGRCANRRCTTEGADWYNRGSGLYYCDECARHINERCLELGQRKACELRL